MNIPTIIAAGGLVWNERNELLMILRQNKWDLPKGKLDEGETLEDCAIREVKEETGLVDVSIGNFIGITQHEYYDKYIQSKALKESHWFAMKAVSNQTFVPQLDEDITEIKWVHIDNINKFLKNSYLNIELIIKQYFSKSSEFELA
jgi:8-oxo-dGTP pyrophosphatase MutT (NUDIX family)